VRGQVFANKLSLYPQTSPRGAFKLITPDDTFSGPLSRYLLESWKLNFRKEENEHIYIEFVLYQRPAPRAPLNKKSKPSCMGRNVRGSRRRGRGNVD